MSTDASSTVVKPASNKDKTGKAGQSFTDKLKNSFKRHTIWWIVGIIVVIAIIGLSIWGIIMLVKRGKTTEKFIAFDEQNPQHAAINIKPETSYLQSYISSALAVGN